MTRRPIRNKGGTRPLAWIKRLRDMRHFAEMLYAALAEEADSALLYGEPGCGKSTVALKFAWQTQGAFDAVVFQLCGQRPIAAIMAELAAKLKLGLETRPPEEQIAAAKAWLAERRALLVLDDIWENDMKALAPGPPVSLLCTSRRRSLPWISRAQALLEFAERVEAPAHRDRGRRRHATERA